MSLPLVIGRGKLYIGAYTGADMTTPPLAEALVYVGNCSEITYTVEEDAIEHQDYSEGIRSIDDEVTLELKYNGAFTTDHITDENITRFTGGSLVGTDIRALASMGTRYQLKFVQVNARTGAEGKTYWFKKTKLKPSGTASLIGDDYQKLGFTFTGLKDSDNYASSPYFDVLAPTSTTTVSTSTTTTVTTT